MLFSRHKTLYNRAMLNMLTQILSQINGFLWGVPAMIALVGTGVYLTFKLNFIQIRGFHKGWRLLMGKNNGDVQPGEITRFEALATALSGTVGTGNIAGVATAITLGGPGAIFWMWITALFGMATKFTSCTLAVKYRQKNHYGTYAGGPMYTLKYGLNKPVLAGFFAVFTIIASFGIGNTVQVNSIVNGLHYIIPQSTQYSFSIGVTIAIVVGMVVLGGVKRIATVASFVVPFMALAYCLVALVIIALHYDQVPHAISTIFSLAFTPHAVGGGSIWLAMRYGVARGVFSNEAGLGSAPIAHAAAKTESPTSQGFVAMLGPFIDTLLICTMTAFVIVIAGADKMKTLTGAALSSYAFEHGLEALHVGHGYIGAWIVGLGLIFFAYTTIIAWSYYADRCVKFLFGTPFVMPFRVLFTLVVVTGAVAPLQLVWQFADLANILMAIPNLISVILMAGVVKKLTSGPNP